VGAVCFALLIRPTWGDLFSHFFALPPMWVAILFGFFVGLIAAQITEAGRHRRQAPWGTLAGTLLGMALGAVLGYRLAYILGSPWMGGLSAVGVGLAGALLGGRVAKGGKR
jgi:hypothetical protein